MGIPYEFNAENFEPSRGSAGNLPVSPPNGYLVQIVNVEKKDTNAAKNSDSDRSWYAEFTLQLTEEGPNQGKMGPYRLNVGNENEQSARIAHSELTTMCYACNKVILKNLSDLQGITFRVVVDMQASDEAREKGWTEVIEVLCADGSKPGQNSAAASPAPQSSPPQTAAIEQGQPQQTPAATAAMQTQAAGGPQQPQQSGWGPQGQPPNEQPQPVVQPMTPQETTPVTTGKPPWAT